MSNSILLSAAKILRTNIAPLQRGQLVGLTLEWRGAITPSQGICYNLAQILIHIYHGGWDDLLALDHIFRKWPEYSGDEAYPVPSPSTVSPAYAFTDNPLWIGEYGSARIRLLDFIISELSHEESLS